MPAPSSRAYPYPSQRVVVLRHGERRDTRPDAPAESDPPLTPEGVSAIKNTAARLKHYLGEDAARAAVLVVSPFLRTVQTAESLQYHNVGSDHAMVVDNTLCEVFGPSRIKTSRAPQLQAPSASCTVGGLPMWGESLETATERYVANFLRNGDVYGGAPASIANSNASLTTRPESQLPSSLVCPAAVTRRVNGGDGKGRSRESETAAASDSANNTIVNSAKGSKPRDVILVTHGDAISAVLSYFYPARVVYEADFLSFIIMRRYGAGNHIYHLDESSGVSWLVDGIDREPQDPTLYALEREREASAAAAVKTSENKISNRTNALESCSENIADSVHDNDEGEALEEDAEEGSAHPASFAGSRMKSRASRLPAQRIHPRLEARDVAACATRPSALPPTHVQPPLLLNPHPPAAQLRRSSNNGGGVGPVQTRQLHIGGHGGASHTPSRNHPKAGEGCEKIRAPGETPAQSSSDPASTTMDDNTSHLHGRSSGGAEEDDSDSKSDNEESKQKFQHDSNSAPPQSPGATDEAESSAPVIYADRKQTDYFPGSVSSCYGLTADPSTNSCVRPQAPSMGYFTALAARERTANIERAPLERREDSTAPQAASPTIISAALQAPPTASNIVTVASASTQGTPRDGSAVAAEPMQLIKGSISCSTYGTTPHHHYVTASFEDSITSTQPCVSATRVISASAEVGESGVHFSSQRLVQRLDRYKALRNAANVSLMKRAMCLLLVVVTAIVLHERLSVVWYCTLAVLWEILFAVVLIFSCRTKSPRLLRVSRVVEQLRFGPVAAAATPMTAHGDESSDVSLYQQHDSAVNGTHYESSMAWQASHHRLGDDDVHHDEMPLQKRRSAFDAAVLCGRHVMATAAKFFILCILSFIGGLLSGGSPALAWSSVGQLYSTPAGLVLTLAYGCSNVVRGVWDETRVSAVLDRC